MNQRRLFLMSASAAGLQLASPRAFTQPAAAKRLLLVHGRDQQGKDPVKLKAEWLEALKRGATKAGVAFPQRVEVAFPFYGDLLDSFARQYDVPLTSDIRARGPLNDEMLAFQAEIAESIRQGAGVTDDQVQREYGNNPEPRGPLNWAWVQAILRAVDKNGGGMSQAALEAFTRDVFLYTRRAGVRAEVDRIVSKMLTDEPTVVVGHSLGSVVAYSVLRNDPRRLQVALYVTVGCPLGVRAIRDQFRPLRYPENLGGWYNAFDKRDVVSLYPLDDDNFPVSPPPIDNNGAVRNWTDNRHGIVGYLDDDAVARKIVGALGG